MECEISEPFEIKPEADSDDLSECDDKTSIGRLVLLLFDAKARHFQRQAKASATTLLLYETKINDILVLNMIIF